MINIWKEPLILEIAFVGLGLILGSFTTMLIHRLYNEEKGIINGRSKCPSCRKTLAWCSLIPVFSWLVQRGMCKNCGKKISPFYPLVELSFALVFLLLVKFAWGVTGFWWLWIIICFALVLFWYDVRYMTVDRRISVPAIVLALGWMFFKTPSRSSFTEGGYAMYLWGGLICGGVYLVQYFYSKGRWVGQGDIDLGVFLGLCLGVKLGVLSLFVAYLIGSVFGISLILVHKMRGTRVHKQKIEDWKKIKVPMGAFLMPSLILFLLFGESIWTWYWGTFIV